MSSTTSIGSYPVEYWTFMARSMSIRLKAIIRAKRVEKDSIPAGVLHDALKYFETVEESAGIRLPSPPTRSYVTGPDKTVKRGASRRKLEPAPNLLDKLKSYKEFVQTLDDPRELTDAEIRQARALIKFFIGLAEAGEAETYYQTVRLDVPGTSVRALVIRNGQLIHS